MTSKMMGIGLLTVCLAHAAGAVMRYVDIDSTNPVPPFVSWETAATNIQAAVDVAVDGETVLVADGTYQPASGRASAGDPTAIVVDKAITVKSVNGRDVTTISGHLAGRSVYLGTNAVLNGFTVVDGTAGSGGGVFCETNAVINECLIRDNDVGLYGGGVYGGIVSNSVLRDNYSASGGGGTYASELYGCVVRDNFSVGDGGGMEGGRARNCLIAKNRAEFFYGGGAYNADLESCTIVSNRSTYGAGAENGLIRNCIAYGNYQLHPNPEFATSTGFVNIANATVTYTCTTPEQSGTGNITNDPRFVDFVGGDYRLAADSPCINVGTNEDWMIGATDLDGGPRMVNVIVDMGCYEYLPRRFRVLIETEDARDQGALWRLDEGADTNWHVSGYALSDVPFGQYTLVFSAQAGWALPTNNWSTISIHAETTEVIGTYGFAVSPPLVTDASDGIFADKVRISWTPCAGASAYEVWRNTIIDSATATQMAASVVGTNYDDTSSVALQTYYYWVRAKNDAGTTPFDAYDAGSRNAFVPAYGNRYVWTNSPSPGALYNAWSNAAHTIQGAIDVAVAGETILVADGTYDVGTGAVVRGHATRVAVTRAVEVTSLNGPEVTFISGVPNDLRCAYLVSNALLVGFTLTDGSALGSGCGDGCGMGGGVYSEGGAELVDCIVQDSQASALGGGVYGGTIRSSILQGNTCATNGGGAAYGELWGCVVRGNTALDLGGGVYGCVVRNGVIGDNQAEDGGGAFMSDLAACTVVSNRCCGTGCGGGVAASTSINSIVYFNVRPCSGPFEDSNMLDGEAAYTCTTPSPGGTGNVTNDPRFVDFAGGDYGLLADSPCIDAGTVLTEVTTDIEGTRRPLDGDGNGAAQWDMGAYEFMNGLADSDGDGVRDALERDAGTDPANADSFLGMYEGSGDGNGLEVCWSSVDNKAYRVLRSTNLVGGAIVEIFASIPADPPLNTVIDATATNEGPYFYWVELAP